MTTKAPEIRAGQRWTKGEWGCRVGDDGGRLLALYFYKIANEEDDDYMPDVQHDTARMLLDGWTLAPTPPADGGQGLTVEEVDRELESMGVEVAFAGCLRDRKDRETLAKLLTVRLNAALAKRTPTPFRHEAVAAWDKVLALVESLGLQTTPANCEDDVEDFIRDIHKRAATPTDEALAAEREHIAILDAEVAEKDAEIERLKGELNAACELHERSMRLIEAELPKDRPNRDTWRAKAIAADICDLRAQVKRMRGGLTAMLDGTECYCKSLLFVATSDADDTTCCVCKGRAALAPAPQASGGEEPTKPEEAFTITDKAVESRSFPEDFDHENGKYLCRCSQCHETFMGHKRRTTCRLCARPTGERTDAEGRVGTDSCIRCGKPCPSGRPWCVACLTDPSSFLIVGPEEDERPDNSLCDEMAVTENQLPVQLTTEEAATLDRAMDPATDFGKLKGHVERELPTGATGERTDAEKVERVRQLLAVMPIEPPHTALVSRENLEATLREIDRLQADYDEAVGTMHAMLRVGVAENAALAPALPAKAVHAHCVDCGDLTTARDAEGDPLCEVCGGVEGKST